MQSVTAGDIGDMKRDGQRVSTLIGGLQVVGCKRRTTGCDGLGW
jgi:hypothetical protein